MLVNKCISVLHFSRERLLTAKLQTVFRTMAFNPQASQPNAKEDANQNGEEKKRPSFAERYNLKALNLYLSKDSTVHCANVIHPGLTPESYGRYGQPTLSTLLRFSSASRMYAMHMPVDDAGRTFLEYGQMTSGYFTFFASGQVTFSRRLYDRSVPKWPLQVKVQGGHIGRTSLSMVASVTSPSDPEGEVLMREINQVVLIDKATRRPVPISDEWRELYQPHCVRGEPLLIKRQPVPDNGTLSVYEMKVAWSDTDEYNHTNFASYPRFAVDAVHDALRHGRLGGWLTAEEVAAGVAQLQLAYLGESVEGDALTIRVWGVEGRPRTVMCSMEAKEQTVNQVMLTFHES